MDPKLSKRPMTAVVLAGDRNSEHELLKYTGACCKAFIAVGREPMLLHVVRALEQAKWVDRILLSGPKKQQLNRQPEVSALVNGGKIGWYEPQATPSTSAYQVIQTLPEDTPILITTADLPFLDSELVDGFCAQSLTQDKDVTVGLAPYECVKASFPQMKKTVLRFKNGHYCGCNLFAVTTRQGRQVVNGWRQVESQRKKPLRIVGLLGWRAITAYLLGFLSLEKALAALSQRMGVRIGYVILPYANAAVDVDSIADYVMVEQKMARCNPRGI